MRPQARPRSPLRLQDAQCPTRSGPDFPRRDSGEAGLAAAERAPGLIGEVCYAEELALEGSRSPGSKTAAIFTTAGLKRYESHVFFSHEVAHARPGCRPGGHFL
jgi:hypothetical protein